MDAKYTSVAEMASRAVKVVKGLASCRLSIWFTGTRVLSVSQNLSLDTRATASALARARTVGSEATLSVHHCVWAWGETHGRYRAEDLQTCQEGMGRDGLECEGPVRPTLFRPHRSLASWMLTQQCGTLRVAALNCRMVSLAVGSVLSFLVVRPVAAFIRGGNGGRKRAGRFGQTHRCRYDRRR